MRKIALIAMLLSSMAAHAAAPTPAIVLERDSYFTIVRTHLTFERLIPADSVLFIGDSIIQNFEVTGVSRSAINFGISGDTTVGVLYRMRQYQTLKTARAVLIESGVNDMGFGERFDKDIPSRYAEMIDLVPKETPVFVLAILPVSERHNKEFNGYNWRIAHINKAVKAVCDVRRNCTYINANHHFTNKYGQLKDSLRRDAVHLNERGYRVLAMRLSRHLPRD